MAWTFNALADAIETHLRANVAGAATTYKYIGKYYQIDRSGDFLNANNGLYPMLVTTFDEVPYAQDQSHGRTNPTIRLVMSLCFRQTGARPEDELTIFYTELQKIQNLLVAQTQQDVTPFGYNEIIGAQLIAMSSLPSFIGKPDQNRKGYNIAQFGVELFMTSI